MPSFYQNHLSMLAVVLDSKVINQDKGSIDSEGDKS